MLVPIYKSTQCHISEDLHFVGHFTTVPEPHEALYLLATEECYWALFYMTLYMLSAQFAECIDTDCK
jgi:hypothetical protein